MKDLTMLAEKAKAARRLIVTMLAEAGSGHPGGSLSCTDILTALYFDEMKVDPQRPQWEERDYCILSKGHAAPALYAMLALKGFFPESELHTLRKLGARLQGHPDRKKTPGVDASAGSLGQGISVACGVAKGLKLDGKPNRVYTILGDGECQEGQVWEAAMFAAHYQLDNLVAFLDRNRLQIDGDTEKVMGLGNLAAKWSAFGWQVIEIDGHNLEQILMALATARTVKGKPVLILANTVKGKGVSFMENNAGWHGKAPSQEELTAALADLA